MGTALGSPHVFRRRLIGVILAFVLVVVAARLLSFRHTFSVRNSAVAALDDVVVVMAGRRVSTGRLAPGATSNVEMLSSKSYGFTVEVRAGTSVYVTAFEDVGLSQHAGVVIWPSFQVTLERH